MSMASQIRSLFKFQNYTAAPHLRDLPIEYQRELCAYFLRHNPTWMHDMLSYLPETNNEVVANAIMKCDYELELGDALFNAAIACFSLEIDEQINTAFSAEAAIHGEWDLETGDLIGWKPQP